MKKHLTQHTLVAALIGLIIGGAVGFEASQFMPSMRTQRAGQFQQGMGGRMMRGGFTAGEILTKDATSLTVKGPDGSTKIVLYSPSTTVSKSAAGTIDDVAVGTNVVVTGKVNSDQSVTAENIQIRPAPPARP
jgi:hypothetical protein